MRQAWARRHAALHWSAAAGTEKTGSVGLEAAIDSSQSARSWCGVNMSGSAVPVSA